MKWTIEEAEAFGLEHGERYAYRYNSKPWIVKACQVVIDLRFGRITANLSHDDAQVEALDLPSSMI
jgi:hypothetical protein